jgi:hypothetical protein
MMFLPEFPLDERVRGLLHLNSPGFSPNVACHSAVMRLHDNMSRILDTTIIRAVVSVIRRFDAV